ncbi:MbcA/ParS/Xre antitoxin family protein [Rhodovulum sp. MB263]|uniref:MbcA/ParS/Xre antitoxin family protein n=1 Tax=Rhodovulum sp. (strain MB263) TaxID=308754 RepID=UPI0012DB34CE|nr:MbcA/ParS/Xre antitoxin family protein [Rhodovulum sp. MB263]
MLQPVEFQESPAPGVGYSPEETAALQRAVLNLMERWGVRDEDAATLLGGLSVKTYRRWRAGDYGRVGRDLADRMSNLLGIHKALRILFQEPARGYAWVTKPNEAFGGRSPLDVMRQGGMDDLQRVRAYLDSARGGW